MSRKKIVYYFHTINPLLTQLLRSKWLDIGLVLFCVFMDLDSVSVHKILTQKRTTPICILTEQAWSITYLYILTIRSHDVPVNSVTSQYRYLAIVSIVIGIVSFENTVSAHSYSLESASVSLARLRLVHKRPTLLTKTEILVPI